MLPPREPRDKANALLVVLHVRDGKTVRWSRSVQASDRWRAPPMTHDFDGDGGDDLVLSVDRPHDVLLRRTDEGLEPIPRPYPISRFEDRDGDGRLEPMFQIPAPIAFTCSGEQAELVRTVPGLTKDGRFVLDHEALHRDVTATCQKLPDEPLIVGEASAQRAWIRCARRRGRSRDDVVQELMRQCRPYLDEASSCRGPCRDIDVLLAIAWDEPLVRLHGTTGTVASLDPKPAATGSLPPELIRRRVRASQPAFRRCFQAGLGPSPNLQARVELRFRIVADGTVSDVQAAQHDLGTRVADCIARAAYRLSFDPPKGGDVTVRYPLVFASGM